MVNLAAIFVRSPFLSCRSTSLPEAAMRCDGRRATDSSCDLFLRLDHVRLVSVSCVSNWRMTALGHQPQTGVCVTATSRGESAKVTILSERYGNKYGRVIVRHLDRARWPYQD